MPCNDELWSGVSMTMLDVLQHFSCKFLVRTRSGHAEQACSLDAFMFSLERNFIAFVDPLDMRWFIEEQQVCMCALHTMSVFCHIYVRGQQVHMNGKKLDSVQLMYWFPYPFSKTYWNPIVFLSPEECKRERENSFMNMKWNDISGSSLWTPKNVKFMIVSNEINKECLPDISFNVKLLRM